MTMMRCLWLRLTGRVTYHPRIASQKLAVADKINTGAQLAEARTTEILEQNDRTLQLMGETMARLGRVQ